MTYFTASLYQALPSGQIAVSPFSIMMAMCMTSLGAGGNTLKEMSSIIQCDHERNGLLVSNINENETVKIANAIFPLEGLQLKHTFERQVRDNYDALIVPQPYIQNPEKSRKTINNFVENETEGMIPELLPSGFITSETKNVIVNTVHLNIKWHTQFDENLTAPDLFLSNFQEATKCPMMTFSNKQQLNWKNYGNGIEGLILPLSQPGYSMEFIKANDFTEHSLLQAEDLVARGNEIPVRVQSSVFRTVKIPKFDITFNTNLVEVFKRMGLLSAFSDNADFSNMFENSRGFPISDIVHEAKVSLSESGVVAAAATAVVFNYRTMVSVPAETEKEFILDRPFIALLRYNDEILFSMRVYDPRM